MKTRTKVASTLHEQIGTYEIGEYVFPIHNGRTFTLELAREQLEKLTRYRLLSIVKTLIGAERYPATEEAVRFVLEAVQMAWYQQTQQPIPERCTVNHTERRDSIMSSTTEKTAASTEKKTATQSGPKIKDVIVEGLKAGHETDAIVSAVHKKFPDAKTGPKDIAFYRYQLRKSGDLPAAVRKTVEPKASKGKTRKPAAKKSGKKVAAKKTTRKSRAKKAAAA